MSQRQSMVMVIAQIVESILPIGRGAKYEDPLDAALKAAGLGRVNGGGSMLDAGQVTSVDIELALRDLDGALQFARARLLALGAPAGSLLLFVRDGRRRALDMATGEEWDHGPAPSPLERGMAASEADDDDEESREWLEASASKILKDFESLWTGIYEYPPADVSGHSAEWLQWYDHVARALEPMGFGFVGDIETVRTDLPEPKRLGFSRKLLAADGITRVNAFQMATAPPKPTVQVVVLASEFEDGRFLSTGNAALKWNVPDFIDGERLPAGSPAEAIAERHAERLAAYRRGSSFAAVRMTSLAELAASEERERTRTRRFRQEQGVPACDELQRLGAEPERAARLHEEMRRLKGL